MPEDIMELSQEDLERIIDERADARLAELEASRRDELEEAQMELARTRNEVREMRVQARRTELELSGYPPAVVATACELLLASDDEAVLSLSIEGEQRYLTVQDVVERMLAAIPADSLLLSQPRVKQGDEKPEEENEVDPAAAAEKLLSDLGRGSETTPLI